MKIFGSFEITCISYHYEEGIKEINNTLIDRNINADDIFSIERIHDKGPDCRYRVIYKKELKTYDSDPRMR